MSRNKDAPQMRLWRLGSLKNSQISNGTADIGRAMFQLMAAPPSAVNMSGAVSPTTREPLPGALLSNNFLQVQDLPL